MPPLIPSAKPLLGEEEKRAVLEVLESGKLAQGRRVQEFEKAFADYIGVKQAIATANGTAALHAALLAHDIGPGDEVITTPFSFIATANAIRMVGAIPVFVDIGEKTFNLNPALIEPAITPKTKAILPVHLFGLPAEMDAIMALAQKHHLIVIEDASQAHGAEFFGKAEFNGKKVGSFGTGCFSFYPTKNMTTGEGGMITTNDEELAKKIRKIINHGSERKYYHDLLGYNYRLTDLAAAIGIEQLKKLPAFNKKRRENAVLLSEHLSSLPGLVVPALSSGHVFHQYTIRVTTEEKEEGGKRTEGQGMEKRATERKKMREELIAQCHQQGLEVAVHYPLAIHQQNAYAFSGSCRFPLPVAEKMAQEVLSLPIHPALSPEELLCIVNIIKKIHG